MLESVHSMTRLLSPPPPHLLSSIPPVSHRQRALQCLGYADVPELCVEGPAGTGGWAVPVGEPPVWT